jgi:hypothetical protein
MRKVLALAIALAVLPSALWAQNTADDEREIRALLDKMCQAWMSPADKGVRMWNEIASDQGFSIVFHNPSDESKTSIIYKPDLLVIVNMILGNGPMARAVHRVKRLEIFGAVAYETGEAEMSSDGNPVPASKIFNIFRKGQDGWKLLFTSAPDEMAEVLY